MAEKLSQLIFQGAFLYEDLARFRFISDDFTFQVLKSRVEEYIFLLWAVYTPFNHVETVNVLIPEFIVAFEVEVRNILNSCKEAQQFQNQYEHATPDTIRRNNGNAGRPVLVVTSEQIESLQKLGFSWAKIASILRSTLLIRRNQYNINTYHDLSDADLDAIISEILSKAPHSGERMVIGSLRSRGLRVQRVKRGEV